MSPAALVTASIIARAERKLSTLLESNKKAATSHLQMRESIVWGIDCVGNVMRRLFDCWRKYDVVDVKFRGV